MLEKRRSDTAASIFAKRGRNPIPIWRTDWNDDLTNKNILVDNIHIRATGKPIWKWSKGIGSGLMRKIFEGRTPDDYRYFEVIMNSEVDLGNPVRPLDPRVANPSISTFSTLD